MKNCDPPIKNILAKKQLNNFDTDFNHLENINHLSIVNYWNWNWY